MTWWRCNCHIGELKQRHFWATHVNRKWGLFHFKAPWRSQICISKCCNYYRDDLSKICTSTGSEVFFILKHLDAPKFVFLSVVTIIETIWPKIWAKTPSKNEKKTTSGWRSSLKNVLAFHRTAVRSTQYQSPGHPGHTGSTLRGATTDLKPSHI